MRDVFRLYGYRNLRVPLVETTPLFVRAIGEVTDVVEKEMYTFEDRLNGESLTLRPEATAGIVRAAIQHNLTYERPQRVWTSGPMFRHERPQKGRSRQFDQFDVEALGFPGPDVDAEQMVMLSRLWRTLGIADGITLAINSIGDAPERHAHRALLIEHFERHAAILDDDAKRRLYTNPLRILDSKNPALQEMIAAAPRLPDLLGPASRAHFDGLQRLLSDNGIAFRIDPRLVRGLDYYNRTVFEFVTDRLGAQGTVAGGGRYDGLFEQLGGKATPACGFALGVERLVLLLQDGGMTANAAPLAYIVHAGDAAAALAGRAAESLRDAGHAVVLNAGGGSFKSQMKRADASGARYAVLIGDDEAATASATVKPLRAAATSSRCRLPTWRPRSRPIHSTTNLNPRAPHRRAAHQPRKHMAVYDLEEQDQLEDLKAWWRQWGNYVSSAVLAVCVGIVGVQGWRWWQHSQAEQASVLYSAISTAVRANDLAKSKDAMAELAAKYSGTGYAPRGGLIVAKLLFDNGDKAGARTQLQWVIEKAGEDNLREIARYRLAEVQFDDKQYDDALRTLDAKHDDAFAGLYADLRGDILAAAGRRDEARAAYQAANAKLDAKAPYHAYVQVKLDALGGPTAPAVAADGCGCAPAPAPAAGTPVPPPAAPAKK